MVGPMLRVLVVGLVLLVAAMAATVSLRRPPPAPEVASYFDMPLALPAFSLDAADGEAFTREDLRGRFTLMFFGFTNCPDICPLTMASLAAAYAELEADATPLPGVVLVSVDPGRDTPERIAEYLAGFDPRFVGATGEQPRLQPLLKALGVSVMIHEFPDRPGYAVTHNGTIYVIGPQAGLIATMSGSPTPAQIATDLKRIRELYRRQHGAPPDL